MCKKKFLLVIDTQNDFIDGVLGTSEAKAIVPNVVEKIKNHDGWVIATQDTHFYNYLDTQEGKKLPVEHCICGAWGWKINSDIEEAIFEKEHYAVQSKTTFGDTDIMKMRLYNTDGEFWYDYTPLGHDIESIEIVGLCTDICVVSNALILKAEYPEVKITVDASCCAGVTPATHKAALEVMKMCQIEVINDTE